MPELVKDGDSKPDGKLGPKGQTKLQKYKWWIIGGLAVVAVLVFYFVRKNQQGQQQQTNQPGIDPATGLPYASEYGGYGNTGGPNWPSWPWQPRPPGGPGPGAGKVTVPSVIGQNRVESRATLAAAGLVYKQANVVHGTAKAVSESPAAGQKVNLGSTVTVTMQEVGGHHHGDGASPATRRAGGNPRTFAYVPTPRISTVAMLTGGAGHTAASAKPGIAGMLPKVNEAA